MSDVGSLIDLAEECFRQADHQPSSSTSTALRHRALQYLDDAYDQWLRTGYGTTHVGTSSSPSLLGAVTGVRTHKTVADGCGEAGCGVVGR
jgi:hypothetical protein